MAEEQQKAGFVIRVGADASGVEESLKAATAPIMQVLDTWTAEFTGRLNAMSAVLDKVGSAARKARDASDPGRPRPAVGMGKGAKKQFGKIVNELRDVNAALKAITEEARATTAAISKLEQALMRTGEASKKIRRETTETTQKVRRGAKETAQVYGAGAMGYIPRVKPGETVPYALGSLGRKMVIKEELVKGPVPPAVPYFTREYPKISDAFALQARGEGVKSKDIMRQISWRAQARWEADQAREQKIEERMSARRGIFGVMGRMIRWTAAGYGMYRVVGAIRDMNREAIQLQHTMAQLEKVMPETTDFQRLEKGFWGIAKTYGLAVDEVAKAGKIWAQQGRTQHEVLALTESSLLAVNAAGLEEAESVDFLTAVTKSFNIEASKTEQVIDKIMRVQARHAITAQDLANAIKTIAPLFAAMDMRGTEAIDTINGMITAIVAVTRVTGQYAATAMKFALSRVYRPVGQQAMAAWGISTYEQRGGRREVRNIRDVMEDIAVQWHQRSSAERQSMAFALGGARRWQAVAALMENYAEAQRVMVESEKAQGDAMKANAIEMRTNERLIKRMSTAWMELGVAFSRSTMIPVIRDLTVVMTTLANALNRIREMSGPAGWALRGLLRHGIELGGLVVGAKVAGKVVPEWLSRGGARIARGVIGMPKPIPYEGLMGAAAFGGATAAGVVAPKGIAALMMKAGVALRPVGAAVGAAAGPVTLLIAELLAYYKLLTAKTEQQRYLDWLKAADDRHKALDRTIGMSEETLKSFYEFMSKTAGKAIKPPIISVPTPQMQAAWLQAAGGQLPSLWGAMGAGARYGVTRQPREIMQIVNYFQTRWRKTPETVQGPLAEMPENITKLLGIDLSTIKSWEELRDALKNVGIEITSLSLIQQKFNKDAEYGAQIEAQAAEELQRLLEIEPKSIPYAAGLIAGMYTPGQNRQMWENIERATAGLGAAPAGLRAKIEEKLKQRGTLAEVVPWAQTWVQSSVLAKMRPRLEEVSSTWEHMATDIKDDLADILDAHNRELQMIQEVGDAYEGLGISYDRVGTSLATYRKGLEELRTREGQLQSELITTKRELALRERYGMATEEQAKNIANLKARIALLEEQSVSLNGAIAEFSRGVTANLSVQLQIQSQLSKLETDRALWEGKAKFEMEERIRGMSLEQKRSQELLSLEQDRLRQIKDLNEKRFIMGETLGREEYQNELGRINSTVRIETQKIDQKYALEKLRLQERTRLEQEYHRIRVRAILGGPVGTSPEAEMRRIRFEYETRRAMLAAEVRIAKELTPDEARLRAEILGYEEQEALLAAQRERQTQRIVDLTQAWRDALTEVLSNVGGIYDALSAKAPGGRRRTFIGTLAGMAQPIQSMVAERMARMMIPEGLAGRLLGPGETFKADVRVAGTTFIDAAMQAGQAFQAAVGVAGGGQTVSEALPDYLLSRQISRQLRATGVSGGGPVSSGALSGGAGVAAAGLGIAMGGVRMSGSASWRNNNPLNIKYRTGNGQITAFARSLLAQGAQITEGSAAADGGTFIRFPSEEAGRAAAMQLLSGPSYANRILEDAMRRWSGGGYGANVAPGLAPSVRMRQLSSRELNSLVESMKRREGWIPGKIGAGAVAGVAPGALAIPGVAPGVLSSAWAPSAQMAPSTYGPGTYGELLYGTVPGSRAAKKWSGSQTLAMWAGPMLGEVAGRGIMRGRGTPEGRQRDPSWIQAGSGIGMALGMLATGGSPWGAALGSALGGALGGALAPMTKALDDNTKATLDNTLAYKELTDQVIHAPSTFVTPPYRGAMTYGSSPNITINVNGGDSEQVKRVVIGTIEEYYSGIARRMPARQAMRRVA